MKIAITGAAGYIGRHVVKELLNKKHDVTAIDFHFKEVDERAHLSDIDIFSGREDLYDKLGTPDLCIHLAWRDGFIHNSPMHMQNLSSHFIFLKNLIDAGCKNIAVMGTMHEVGYWEGVINADTPCNPLSQYGIAKNALRQSLLQYATGKNVSIYWLRAYYITGDDEHNCSVFTKILRAAEDGKDTFPFTSGKNQYDFIDIKELAKQIVAVSTQKDYTGIINVCTGTPVSLKEQVESFIKQKKLNISLDYGAFPDRVYDSPIVYGDSSIICKIMSNT
jgi:nucleoside-diphosphate-sugar epimerase|nr:NAD(P)-dependent oxidoreductase [uncultured Acetatifactor sp.]